MYEPLLALFDVDETLIQGKSMFSYLNKVLLRQGWSEEDCHFAVTRFHRLAESGMSRECVNASYYCGFAGLSRSWILRQGREWFLEQMVEGNFFHEPVLSELRQLHATGTAIALISGSFEACLTPIAEAVGAAYVLGSEPTTDEDDVYTGEIAVPMIGRAKGAAARKLMEALQIDPQRVRAYGDHTSDIPLLRSVGESVVVGSNPEMQLLAIREGWRHLPLEFH